MPQASGIAIPPKGLVFNGVITNIGTNQFSCAGLTGYGNHFFDNWYMFISKRASGAAPTEESRQVVTYTSAAPQYGGTFTYTADFTTPIAVGDELYFVSPILMSSNSSVTVPSNNIKLTSNAEVNTTAGIYTKVKTITFDATRGSVRVSFDIKVDVAGGTASAIIYHNGSPVLIIISPPTPITHTDTTGVYHTYTQDIPGIVAGDTIEIWSKASVGRTTYVRNFQIEYDILAISDAQFQMDGIYFDSIKGIPGTVWPIGSPYIPSNTLADARTMMTQRNVFKLYLVGTSGQITFDSDIDLELVGNPAYDIYIGLTAKINFLGDVVCAALNGSAGGGIVTIYGNCVAAHISNAPTSTNSIAINGNCYAGDISQFGSGGIAVNGNCQIIGNMDNTIGHITITGNCYVGGNVNNTFGGEIDVYGKLAIVGLVTNTDIITGAIIEFISPLEYISLGGSATAVISRIVSRGSVQIDSMVAGATVIIDLSGGTLTLSNICNGGTIDLYGDCTLINNSVAPFVTVNDHRIVNQQLLELPLPSSLITPTLSLVTLAGDKPLGNITIMGLPTGATVKHIFMQLKCQAIENTNVAANNLNGAQNIQAQNGAGALLTGIAFAGGEYTMPAVSGRLAGDIIEGTTDLVALAPANGDVINFQWTQALAVQNNLNLYSIQITLKLWYSV